jgi:hypothetical protein
MPKETSGGVIHDVNNSLDDRREMARKPPPPPPAAKKGRSNEVVDEEPLPENGHDTFTSASGARYEGEWKRFEGVVKRHGKGEYTTDDFSYQGDFEEDLFHGHGTLAWQNGEAYGGEFAKGDINGQGEMAFLDGSRYIGQWRDGRMHGIGTFLTVDGKKWTGAWCHGMSTCPIFPQVLPPPPQEEEEEVWEEGY